jgi:3'-phosphoadenosine 5'-phosphosulfate sulfotransferase (PAPS reductase)/FAD synthetase
MNAKEILYLLNSNLDKNAVHFIGISGGKDSGALIALALHSGINATYMFCDTGHEKPETYAYLDKLKKDTGIKITVLKKEITDADFAARRDAIKKAWNEWYTPQLRSIASKALGVRQMFPPVKNADLDIALNELRPSGDIFRDTLVMHGTMPQKKGKFCSLELKTLEAWDHIQSYLDNDHDGEDVYWWSGVRAQESPSRALLPESEPCGMDSTGYVTSLRPILNLTHDEVFELCNYMNVPINPLYMLGDKRVGCGECFEANKRAIKNSFTRNPELLERTKYLEESVAKVNRRAIQMGLKYVPFFREAYRLNKFNNWASAEQIYTWSLSGRGTGSEIEVASCDSVYGLCD